MAKKKNNELNLDHLDIRERALILQGLSLIEDGINLIEWMDEKVNENTTDAFTLLKDRFHHLRTCVFAGKHFESLAVESIIDKTQNLSADISNNGRLYHEIRMILKKNGTSLKFSAALFCQFLSMKLKLASRGYIDLKPLIDNY